MLCCSTPAGNAPLRPVRWRRPRRRRRGRGLLRARERLTQPWPVADGFLLEPPARLAPYATDVPRRAGVVASAVLSADGQRALTVAAALQGATALWVRNGRGETVRVTLDQRVEVAGTVSACRFLRLETPLPTPPEVIVAVALPVRGERDLRR